MTPAPLRARVGGFPLTDQPETRIARIGTLAFVVSDRHCYRSPDGCKGGTNGARLQGNLGGLSPRPRSQRVDASSADEMARSSAKAGHDAQWGGRRPI